MSVSSLGDLSQGYMLRSRNASLKQEIQRLTAELTTGQTTDMREKLSGNYSFLTDVDRKVALIGNYAVSGKEASHFTDAAQTALDNYGDLSQSLSNSLLIAGTSPVSATASDIPSQARNTVNDMVSALNRSFAGRSLFSGNATDQTALVDGNTLIAAIQTAIAGAATPADMFAATETWFNDPAGFRSLAYQGGTEPLAAFAIARDENLAVDIRADDPAFAKSLAAAAVAALAADPAFGLSDTQQAELFTLTAQKGLAGQSDITTLQSRVGFAQARIETVTARNSAELTSLRVARNELLEVDSYEAATQLEEVQFRLQSLYSVTVRMSQLSLVNYL